MRASPAEYLSLRLRVHELLHDVPLYNVSVVDRPGRRCRTERGHVGRQQMCVAATRR